MKNYPRCQQRPLFSRRSSSLLPAALTRAWRGADRSAVFSDPPEHPEPLQPFHWAGSRFQGDDAGKSVVVVDAY